MTMSTSLPLTRVSGQKQRGPVEIGFNTRYVLDMLAALTGDEITIEIVDPGSPAIFSDGRSRAVLMPMRV